jgi:hypothetical protein
VPLELFFQPMVKNYGLQLTDLIMPGWSKTLKRRRTRMVRRASYANDLGTIFYGSLWMGLNARGLPSPGSSNLFLSSIQRKHQLEDGSTPHSRFLSTHVNVTVNRARTALKLEFPPSYSMRSTSLSGLPKLRY